MGNLFSGLFDANAPGTAMAVDVTSTSVSQEQRQRELAEMEQKREEERQRLIDLEVRRRIAEKELQELEERRQASGSTYFGPATMFPNGPGLPISTRGPIGPWTNVGLIYTKNPADNKMMIVEGQMVDIGRRRFRYRFRNPKTGIAIPYKGGKEMYELIDGDTISIIPGLESLGPWIYQKTINHGPF